MAKSSSYRISGILIFAFALLTLFPNRVHAVAFFDGDENHIFYPQFYLGASISNFGYAGPTSYSDTGSGFQMGFSGSLRVFNRFYLVGMIDLLTPSITGQTSSFITRFDQTLMFDLNRSPTHRFKFGLGWDLDYADAGAKVYGFKAVVGLHTYLGLRLNRLNFYTRVGPVFNTVTHSMNNYCLVYGLQVPVAGTIQLPNSSLYIEGMNIVFAANNPDSVTNLQVIMAGLSLGL